MKSTLKTITMLLLIVTTLHACNKESDTPQPKKYRIVKITEGANTKSISYASDGAVQSIQENDNQVTQFNYSTNTIITTRTINGVFDVKRIVTLNNGLVINVRRETNSSGSVWTNDAYEYNGTQVTKRTFTNSAGITPSETNYTWENGNMTPASPTVAYEYDLNRPMQEGDYFGTVSDLPLYGKINMFYRNRNLLKSVVSTGSGTFITNYNYTFDTSGKITAVTVTTGTTSTTFNFEYEEYD